MTFQPEKIIKNLQGKPYATRLRILWTAVAVAAILLIIIWVVSLKNSISGLNRQETAETDTVSKLVTLVTVERVESSDNTLKIYFNVDNPTDDILNFPSPPNITLSADEKKSNPKQVTDRQGKPFVQKILSHTQNFGILIFESVASETARLTIDQMYFEQTPVQQLKQVLELNLKTLNKSEKLRN